MKREHQLHRIFQTHNQILIEFWNRVDEKQIWDEHVYQIVAEREREQGSLVSQTRRKR